MPKRPGHVNVTTEVGFCPFCNRARNLRREDHVMGALVRSTVTCETCHSTLSSTMGPATAVEDAPQAEVAVAPAPAASTRADDDPEPAARPTRANPKPAGDKPATTKTAADKPATTKTAADKPATTKPAAKPATAAKARTMAPVTRRTTKS